MTKSIRQSQAAYLLIDISNSYTKFAHASNSRLLQTTRIPTETLTGAHIERALETESSHKNRDLFRRASKEYFGQARRRQNAGYIRRSEDQARCRDRLSKPALHRRRSPRKCRGRGRITDGCPSIVVDFGTAVTFDVISTQRAYIGEVIAPGLDAMTNYLYQRTALLPKLTLSEPHNAIGKSTRAAMMSGAIFGYRGLVREILAQITHEAFGETSTDDRRDRRSTRN